MAALVSAKRIASCVVVVATSMTGACSSPGSTLKPPVAVGSSPVSAPPGPTDQAKQAALAAYTGMWTDYSDAAQTADYKDQRLTQHATDEALGDMVRSLYRLQHEGLVIRGTLKTTPTVVGMLPANTPTQADIKDCASDINWLQYVAATGKPKDKVPGGHRIVTAHVTKQYDVWRVASYHVQAEGTC